MLTPTHTRKAKPALPLRRQPGRAEDAEPEAGPVGTGAGGGDRGRGGRPAARRLPAAARWSSARGARRGRSGTTSRRTRRVRRRSQLDPLWGELFPAEQARIRAAAGRAGRRAVCTASRSGCGRTGSPGWCGKWRAAGGRQRDAGDGPGGRGDDHVHIPMTFRKRGGRKLVVAPDGTEWAPRPRVDNAMAEALGAGVPVAEDAGPPACTRPG